MTVAKEDRRTDRYACDGSTTEFPFAYKVFEEDDVDVVISYDSGETEESVSPTLYTVTLHDDQDNDPGGTVTFKAAPALGATLVVVSCVEYTQEMIFTNRGGFYPAQLNSGYDKNCILIQQLKEKTDRALLVPITSEKTPEEVMQELMNAQKIASAEADRATEAADRAEDMRDECEDILGRVTEEGDYQVARIETAGDKQLLYEGLAAGEATWDLDEDVKAGDVITIPEDLQYVTKRNMLRLNWEGTTLTRDEEWSEYPSEGEVFSGQFVIQFDAPAGSTFNAWVTPVGKLNVTEDLVDEAIVAALNAKACSDLAQETYANTVVSENNAATSAANTARAESIASAAASAAQTSEANAAVSEANAKASELAAAASAAAAAVSESNASSSETSAAESAEICTEAVKSIQEASDVNLLYNGLAAFEVTWTLESDVSAGTIITIPDGCEYINQRNMLRLAWEGQVLTRDEEWSEYPNTENTISSQFVCNFPAEAGSTFNAWVTPVGIAELMASTLQTALDNLEQSEANAKSYAESASASASDAATSASEAADSAAAAASSASSASTSASNAASSADSAQASATAAQTSATNAAASATSAATSATAASTSASESAASASEAAESAGSAQASATAAQTSATNAATSAASAATSASEAATSASDAEESAESVAEVLANVQDMYDAFVNPQDYVALFEAALAA